MERFSNLHKCTFNNVFFFFVCLMHSIKVSQEAPVISDLVLYGEVKKFVIMFDLLLLIDPVFGILRIY